MRFNKKTFIICSLLVVIFVLFSIHRYLSHRFIQLALPQNYLVKNPVFKPQKATSFLFPPQGYSWKECSHTGTAILTKKTWFFSSESTGSLKTCYITVEPLEKEGSFKTGVTVKIIDDYINKTYIPIAEYARNYTHEVSQKQLTAKIVQTNTRGFIGSSTSITTYDEIGQYEKKVYTIALGNTKTNTLYIISYETPVGEINTHKDEVNKIVSSIILDSFH